MHAVGLFLTSTKVIDPRYCHHVALGQLNRTGWEGEKGGDWTAAAAAGNRSSQTVCK